MSEDAKDRALRRLHNAEETPEVQQTQTAGISPAVQNRMKQNAYWHQQIVEQARSEEQNWLKNGEKYVEDDRDSKGQLRMIDKLVSYFGAIPQGRLYFNGNRTFSNPTDAYYWNALHSALGGKNKSNYQESHDKQYFGGKSLRTKSGRVKNNAWSAVLSAMWFQAQEWDPVTVLH